MPGIEFFDTNILIYAHDTQASAAKRARAAALVDAAWEHGQAHVSTQVLQELYVVLARKVSKAIALETVTLYMHWPLEIITSFTLLAAMALSERQQLSLWDSLIIAAAQQARATVLWTEDLNAGQRFGEMVIRNPFLE